MGELEHEPLSGIEMAAPCTERRQQEQAGGGETQTDGCQGGSERPLLAISERNLLRTIHRDEVRRQQAAGITERVPQRHGRGRSFRGDLLLRRGGNRGHQEIFISQGEFILSDIEKELSMEKRTVVVNNPLTVNCEEKRILSQLYKNLSEKISEDHFEEFATVNQKVIQFMDKVTSSSEYNLTYDVDFQAAGLIKYCNVHMDSCYDSLTEKFINYLRTIKQICNVDIVFVLNLKQYFSTEDLREIYKHCFYTKMYLINLEGVKSDPIESDRYVIIDKDLCVLDLVY